MLHDPKHPHAASVFLDNWEFELRGGFTPAEDLDLEERLNQYLQPDVTPDVEAALRREVEAAAPRMLAQAQEDERGWPAWTDNDALGAAMAELRAQGLFAAEDFGLTLRDGWARLGVEDEGCAGAVFYTQQDVYDALRGWTLPVAFGSCGPEPGGEQARCGVAEAALEAFSRAGLPASWTGAAADRIQLGPFPWARRRWIEPGPRPERAPVPWRREARQVSPVAPPEPAALERFTAEVLARRTGFGFDRVLFDIMRGVWQVEFGGERGQCEYDGDPHTFVPAGGILRVSPADGLANPSAAEAAALRARGAAARDPAASEAPAPARKRPWWKLWE